MQFNMVLFPKSQARWRSRLRRVIHTAGAALDQRPERFIWTLLHGGKIGW